MSRRRGSLWQSMACAVTGIVETLRTQRNARIHLAATVTVLIAAAALRLGTVEWIALLLTVALVWVAELLNTGVEAVVDLVSPDDHELARLAKDASSGAVLVAAAIAVCVGAIIFGPRLWDLLG